MIAAPSFLFPLSIDIPQWDLLPLSPLPKWIWILNFTFDVPDDRIATTELFFQLVLSSNSAFYEFGFPLMTRRPLDNNKQTWIKKWNKKVYLSNKSKTLNQFGGCVIKFQNVVIGKLSFIKFFYESVKHWKSRVENKMVFW